MVKKNIVILIMIIVIVATCGISNAADLKTNLDIVQNASETKELANDQGFISKTIVDSSSEKGEVTVEVKLSNTSKETEKYTETEIMLVVDNSGSMGYKTATGEVRRNILVRAMRNLVNSIYNNSSNVKVGLVRFANTGDLLSGSTSLMCNLTKEKQKMVDAIDKYENLNTSVTVDDVTMEHCEAGTNIDAGLKKANENFSADCKNKIIILLTDGVPNASVSSNTPSAIYADTKARLQTIGNSGVSVISLMTGVTKEDTEALDNDDSKKVVENIFGTTQKPTTGKFYNIADTNLEKVVTTDILADVMEKIRQPMNTTKIVDYFPSDITDNFEISFVGKTNVGTASNIDMTTKTITWDIGTLKGDEVATLKYKLKIKDMKNTKILNKTIATNDKIVLTYKDFEAKDYIVELTSSPKIKLSEVKEDLTATVSYNSTSNTTGIVTKNNNSSIDNTIVKTVLPKAGINPFLIIAGGFILVISLALFIKYRRFKDIK